MEKCDNHFDLGGKQNLNKIALAICLMTRSYKICMGNSDATFVTCCTMPKAKQNVTVVNEQNGNLRTCSKTILKREAGTD